MNKYFTDLQAQIDVIDNLINILNITDEYDLTTDYAALLLSLVLLKRYLQRYYNGYKYIKYSEADFTNILDTAGSKEMTIQHIVTGYETPSKIAKKYNIDISQVTDRNNKASNDIVTGDTLNLSVPNTNQFFTNEELQTFPFFGDRNGDCILGSDLGKELKVDWNGDLMSLNNSETFRQGILNRLTTAKGDYPLNDSFGLDRFVGGSNLPGDLSDAMFSIEAQAQIMNDYRVKEITDVVTVREANSITIQASILGINGKWIIING